MNPDFEERANRRRKTWQGAVESHSVLIDRERNYWRQASASERLDAVWELALEAWSLKEGERPAPRLQGSPIGIRRRTG